MTSRTSSVIAFALLALGCAALPARAAEGPPFVHAHAFLIEDARTGDVLAAYRPHAHLPIASITKLMTVLVVLEHKHLTDVVTVDPRAAAVGEETVELEAGERITVRDLVEGALIQSANDAADALALSLAPDFPAFARLMNAKARTLGLRDTHFVRPDGLDADGAYSSAFDVTRLARDAMRTRFIRQTVRMETASIASGRVLHTWDDLLSLFPHVIGVKTGHTDAAGWCQVAAVRGRGVTVYATLLGGPTRSVRNADLESLLSWGLAQFRVVPAIQGARTYAAVRLPYGRRSLDLVTKGPLQAVVRLGQPLTERIVAAVSVGLPVAKGTVLGRVEVWSRNRLVGRRDLVASRTVNRPALPARLGWYAGRTLHHLVHLL